MNFNWRCPFCGHNAVITEERYSTNRHEFHQGTKHGSHAIKTTVIVCPNDKCREFVIQASLLKWMNGNYKITKESWTLVPPSEMRVFPDYVPEPILADYKEACLVRNLSPKASATLSRRCLQGMIRNFWGIVKARLIDEIEAIEEKVDPLTWSAIDAVRKIGNIGAHMEKDINLIIDVDPEEASLLIGLIEILINDWYIAKYEREQRLAKIVSVAALKAEIKTGNASQSEPSPESTET